MQVGVILAKRLTVPQLKSVKLFDARTVQRSRLLEIATDYHRGDNCLCDVIVGLIEQIAELRGFKSLGIVEIEPYRTHAWKVCAYDSKDDMWAYSDAQITTELIDYMRVNGDDKWVALHYAGKRPEPLEVAKKVKEIGARSIGG